MSLLLWFSCRCNWCPGDPAARCSQATVVAMPWRAGARCDRDMSMGWQMVIACWWLMDGWFELIWWFDVISWLIWLRNEDLIACCLIWILRFNFIDGFHWGSWSCNSFLRNWWVDFLVYLQYALQSLQLFASLANPTWRINKQRI